MSNPTKRVKYSEFISMTPEDRLVQSEFFRKKYPNMVPTVVCAKSSKDMP